MRQSICLNADVGELPGEEGRALDRAILDVVSRCSIACGGHAGDEASMSATVEAAQQRSVVIGAHPSYPDRETFGRARNNVTPAELIMSLLQQVQDLLRIADAQGAVVRHIKPHGSLYNDAARDPELAELVVSLCQRTGVLSLLGPPSSALQERAQDAGLHFVAEGFADRTYEADGSLTPRSVEGAVIHDTARQLEQVMHLVSDGQVMSRVGEIIDVKVETICLHGDTPGAAEAAATLRAALGARGIQVHA
ncbi:MAG: 5-oxoprolinase subunit PxpA [Hyphomonas sp.]|nr:5-oxoprolinase subunit PxpA [Hyphomonas sp.]MCB9971588.1 5-oxoprolinase subunit PxpA [Hyphomonas sp.]